MRRDDRERRPDGGVDHNRPLRMVRGELVVDQHLSGSGQWNLGRREGHRVPEAEEPRIGLDAHLPSPAIHRRGQIEGMARDGEDERGFEQEWNHWPTKLSIRVWAPR